MAEYQSTNLLTSDETAEFLRIPKCTLYKYTHNKRIPYYRVGRHILFARSDLEAWLEDHRVAVKV